MWSTFRVFGGNPAVGIVLGIRCLFSGFTSNAWAVAQGGEVTAMNSLVFIPVVGLQVPFFQPSSSEVVGAEI